MQLKRTAKLLTVIGLTTKHTDCRITSTIIAYAFISHDNLLKLFRKFSFPHNFFSSPTNNRVKTSAKVSFSTKRRSKFTRASHPGGVGVRGDICFACHISFFSLCETAQYKLKYCERAVTPHITNQSICTHAIENLLLTDYFVVFDLILFVIVPAKIIAAKCLSETETIFDALAYLCCHLWVDFLPEVLAFLPIRSIMVALWILLT